MAVSEGIYKGGCEVYLRQRVRPQRIFSRTARTAWEDLRAKRPNVGFRSPPLKNVVLAIASSAQE
jgi:hypothetical protein